MKNEIISHSCRICLTRAKKMRSLYKPVDEGDEAPNKMLYHITGIKVEKLDEHETLPKSICRNCELSLSMAFEFRKKALKTHEIITTYLKDLDETDSIEEKKSSTSVSKFEYESAMDLEPLDCVDALEDDVQNLSDNDHKYPIGTDEDFINSGDNFDENDDIYDQQEVSFDMSYCKQNGNEENTNRNYIAYQQLDVEENEEHNQEMSGYSEENIVVIPTEEVTNSINTKKSSKINSTKPNKKKISISTDFNKTEGEKEIYLTESLKQIPRRGRSSSKNTNQNNHICDICGNVFAKRGRMMEHRQRHDKECRFSCEICDKKFLTRELLRKHMFSHSGGKPLKCGYCSRTFYYESVRKAHEVVHKGLRPYICDVCGKGFSYAHALKMHTLIHAEIKLYRCEYCQKDFRLQHHMKQHQLTKLHQNAVLFAQSGAIALGDCDEIIKRDQVEEDIYIEEIQEDQLTQSS